MCCICKKKSTIFFLYFILQAFFFIDAKHVCAINNAKENKNLLTMNKGAIAHYKVHFFHIPLLFCILLLHLRTGGRASATKHSFLSDICCQFFFLLLLILVINNRSVLLALNYEYMPQTNLHTFTIRVLYFWVWYQIIVNTTTMMMNTREQKKKNWQSF